MPAITNAKRKLFEILGEDRIEAEFAPAQFESWITPLQQIECSGHRAEVYAFGCSSALNVANVAM